MTQAIQDENSLALLAFNVGSNQFDINRGLAYISMRDQVLRARTLINAAIGAKLFVQRPATATEFAEEAVNYDVAVMGAGVGGISVALAAVENGLKTLVIDKSGRCFELLRSGTDRLLSTTVYDWPANHFKAHAFPQLPSITPRRMRGKLILNFPSCATSADALAQHLDRQVQRIAKQQSGLLKFAHGVTISGPSAITVASGRCLSLNPGQPLPLLDGSSTPGLLARIVVYAFGFGSEKVMTTPAANINASFWGYATLEADLQDLATKPGTGKVNIQGAGDGGLQEALRFAFDTEWQDLSKVVDHLEKCVVSSYPEWGSRLRDIMLAEDNAARAYMWGYDQKLVFQSVDAVHQALIDGLIGKSKKQVQKWFQTVGRSQDLLITVYDNHLFSGRVYALNRFLFKLLVTFTTLVPQPVQVRRKQAAFPKIRGDIRVDRSGLAQINAATGPATKADYLRRATLRAIPNQYGIVG